MSTENFNTTLEDSQNKPNEVHCVLDTETTGIKPEEGHRVVEIGIVKMINNIPTGEKLQIYIKPVDENGKQIPVGDSIEAHGLTDEFLSDKPTMPEVIDQMIDFVTGTTLVIHNAPFDVKFLQKELEICEKPKLFSFIKNVHCTLKASRMFYEGSKHKLDNLCDRFSIDRSRRTVHGALLDAELLAECFQKMNLEYDTTKIEGVIEQVNWQRPEIKRFNSVKLATASVSQDDATAHNELINKMSEKNKKPALFAVISENTSSSPKL